MSPKLPAVFDASKAPRWRMVTATGAVYEGVEHPGGAFEILVCQPRRALSRLFFAGDISHKGREQAGLALARDVNAFEQVHGVLPLFNLGEGLTALGLFWRNNPVASLRANNKQLVEDLAQAVVRLLPHLPRPRGGPRGSALMGLWRNSMCLVVAGEVLRLCNINPQSQVAAAVHQRLMELTRGGEEPNGG